ncbi:MAG: hypothetical protein WDZ51_02070 [Pirellulaceae bacterium]
MRRFTSLMVLLAVFTMGVDWPGVGALSTRAPAVELFQRGVDDCDAELVSLDRPEGVAIRSDVDAQSQILDEQIKRCVARLPIDIVSSDFRTAIPVPVADAFSPGIVPTLRTLQIRLQV